MRARRTFAALTVPVVALLGLTACQEAGAAPGSAASSPAAAPSEVESAAGDSKLALDRSSAEAFDTLRARTAAAASAAGSYRATTTVTFADMARTTMLVTVAEVELTPGLALHETVQQDGVNSEIVLVDGVFYVKSAAVTGDDFVRVDPAEAQQVLGGDAESMLDEVDTFGSLDDLVPAVRTFQRDGAPVHVDGVLCQPYEIGLDRDALARAGSMLLGVDPAQTKLVAALPEVLTYRAWVGVGDDLVRTFSIELDGVTFETLYTRWGEDFAVAAPPAVVLGIAPA